MTDRGVPASLQSPSGRRIVDARSAACCIGHRGARAFAPENTLAAFGKAASMGCAMVELDVHLSRDGQLVVHHDDRLDRCTDVQLRFPDRTSRFVSEFTLDELRRLDAGGHYLRQLAFPADQREAHLRSLTNAEIECHVTPQERQAIADGGIGIPTLDEALQLARALDLMVNVEIKSIPRLYAGIADAVVAQVRAAGMQRHALVSSFDHEQLPIVRRLLPELATGVLTSDRLARPADYLQLLGAAAYHPGCYDDFDSLGFGSAAATLQTGGIEQVLRAGGLVFPWTCNQTGRMRQLIAARVTGVITDYPNRFAEAASAPAG